MSFHRYEETRGRSWGRAPAAPPVRSARAAHGEGINLERRLPDADGHALALFAAHAHALVELEVVSDHADAREHIGTVADQRRAFDRARSPCRSSIRYASLAENTNLPLVMSTWPPPKLTAYRPLFTERDDLLGSLVGPCSM